MAVLQKEKFYTEGAEELKSARIQIAHWSLQRAADRIAAAKQLREDADARKVRLAMHQKIRCMQLGSAEG